MKRVCAWCNKPYGDNGSDGDGPVTHGICETCERLFKDLQAGSLRDHLNMYSEPILCVDSNCRVLTANDTACDLLGHSRHSIGDLLFGQVVLCPWALRDDGCGTHEHCLACTVRRIVGDSFASGTGLERRPAYVERTLSDGHVQRINLIVTSEHRKNLVLVRIDEVSADDPDREPADAGG
jgi:hypothetical protein